MKKFWEVTILGMFLGLGGCFSGPATGQRAVIQEEQPIDPEAEAREAAEIQAGLLACQKYYEAGELEKGRAVVEGILKKRPDHPKALFYWEKLNTKRYTTVYPGQTLSGIAAYYYDDGQKWPILARANGIESAKRVGPYQRLQVPWLPACKEGKDEAGRLGRLMFGSARPTKIILHPVQEGDTLEVLAKRHYGDKGFRFFLADYNQLEDRRSLSKGSSLKIPIFPQRKKDTAKEEPEALKRGNLAFQKQAYEEASRYFASVPKGSPHREEAQDALSRCKIEGASHYERLGDEALQKSEPRDACRYWQKALRLDPGREGVEKKLQEAEDLVKALDMLPTVP